MLVDTGLPRNLWPEVMQAAAYLRNRSLVKGQEKTPEELWTGQKPDLTHLRAYGCDSYALIPKGQQDKLAENSKKYALVGYTDTTAHYRL